VNRPLVTRYHGCFLAILFSLLASSLCPAEQRRKVIINEDFSGEIRKRVDTLAVDRATRNSDKISLDLTLSVLDLRLFNADNETDQKLSTSSRNTR
jgi:hypothetical protein